MPFEFSNPWSAATSALDQFLVDRDVRKRQEMLDSLTQQQSARADADLKLRQQQHQETVDINRAAEARAKADQQMQERTDAASRYRLGDMVTDDADARILGPGFIQQAPAVDPNIAAAIRVGNPDASIPTMQAFRGTPEQRDVEAQRDVIKTIGQRLEGVTDRKQATQIALEAGVPLANVDEVVNTFIGKDVKEPQLVWVTRQGQPQIQDPATGSLRAALPGEIQADAHWMQQPAPPSVTNINATTDRRVDAVINRFDANPIVKRYATQSEALEFVTTMSDTTVSPADDQALIYAFAKSMDPDSVVREGEYATVQKYSQAWIKTVGYDLQRVITEGQFLSPKARTYLKTTIRAKVQAGATTYNNFRNEQGKRIDRITGLEDGASYLTDYGSIEPESQGRPPGQGAPSNANDLRSKYGY